MVEGKRERERRGNGGMKVNRAGKTVTMSFARSCWSLMMNIISNRDKMVGMKSIFYKRTREERVLQYNG